MRILIDGDSVAITADDFTNLHDCDVIWTDIDPSLLADLVQRDQRAKPRAAASGMENIVVIFGTNEDRARERAEAFAAMLTNAGLYFTQTFNETGFEFEMDPDDFLRAVEEERLEIVASGPIPRITPERSAG